MVEYIHLEYIEQTVSVRLNLFGDSVLQGAEYYYLRPFELMEFGGQEVLPAPDRPGGGDILPVLSRAMNLRAPALQKRGHNPRGRVSGSHGCDLLVRHVLPEVWGPRSRDVDEAGLEVIHA